VTVLLLLLPQSTTDEAAPMSTCAEAFSGNTGPLVRQRVPVLRF